MQLDLARTLYATPPTGVILVSTIDKDQRNNIAPFAWWIVVSKEPPLIALSIKPATNTYRIIKSSGEYVIGLPEPKLLDTVYASAKLDKEPDEFGKLGLRALPAARIKPPRIKECQVNIECRYHDEIACGDHMLVIGEVLAVDVREDILSDDDSTLRANLKPLGHLTKNKFLTMQGNILEASEPGAGKE